MAAITPSEALAYRERWAAVEAFEKAELRAATMDAKLRQLSALMASRSLFVADPERERGTQQVRERWALLRKALGD